MGKIIMKNRMNNTKGALNVSNNTSLQSFCYCEVRGSFFVILNC